jgi:heptosyltransferase-3
MQKFRKIILSRTDNLGDVILTLPLAGIIKSVYKDCEIYFIGKSYTQPIIMSSRFIDHFLDREKVIADPRILKNTGADAIIHIYPDKSIAKAAFKAGIPLRAGTSHRWFHWLYCNKLIRFSRRKSDLHEIQLNQKLLKPLGIEISEMKDLENFYGMSKVHSLKADLQSMIRNDKFNLILHPKSKGSAREWPLKNYSDLIKSLPAKSFEIFITGTQNEGDLVKSQLPEIYSQENVHDLSGKCSLEELIGFIKASDGLIACSTGPLHIASALGKYACGIYPPMKPIHPGRWAPVGKKAMHLVLQKECSECRNSNKCACIESISVSQVTDIVKKWREDKG